MPPRPVETGAFAADGVRIASGLIAGDLVVTAGTQFMTPDKKVRIADAVAADAAPPTPRNRLALNAPTGIPHEPERYSS